jgi:hypothetical protein
MVSAISNCTTPLPSASTDTHFMCRWRLRSDSRPKLADSRS